MFCVVTSSTILIYGPFKDVEQAEACQLTLRYKLGIPSEIRALFAHPVQP